LAYYNEDQLYRYFDKAITTEANKKIDKLRKEIDYLYAKEMKKVKEDLSIKKNLELNKQLKALQVEYQDQINKIGVGFDKKLIEERQFMVNFIYQSVLLKLGDYIQTKTYQKQMILKLEALKQFVKNKKVLFYVSISDPMIKDAIYQVFGKDIEIKTSHDIHLGGYLASILENHIEIDQTLDTKLEERKAWFNQNSKLFIRA